MKEMGLGFLEKNIFIGNSAATSHMTSGKVGVYDLVPINGSVMIGNEKSISCTHKGKLDVICKHKDGSMARETWEVKSVPRLNHDLFSFTKAMKDGWQMNGRWKEGGLMIELFKTKRASMKFDRMIPSGSSWLMGIKVHRVYDEAHAAMEAGKSITARKLHQMTGHTGEHLLKPTANYMKLKLVGRLPPCEACAKAKIRQKSPIGMEEIDPGSSPEDCYQLKKGIYGLCQAARQFWKKFVDTIKQESSGFQVSPADPCVLFKEDKLGICIIIMYVDDMLIIGKKEQIEDFASKIQKVFSVKIQHNLADYLGCEFYMNKERTRGWLGQPSIIKSLEQKFGERAMKERLSLTPGTPRFTARRVEDPEDKVNPQDHEIYRSGVGTLLYLTKHSRPDICNPVRELSKTMDAPAPAHLKEMYKLIRHVLATKGYGLKLELRKDIITWALKALSDSDFASDKETRISVFGYIIYFLWNSHCLAK